MGLTRCPECAKKISDKAQVCPACGRILINKQAAGKVQCPECGRTIPGGMYPCPACGYPFCEQSKKKGWIIALIALAALFIVGGAVFMMLRSNKYAENMTQAAYYMFQGAAKAEDISNLTLSVWSNSIYQKDDVTTNKYTKQNAGSGEFWDDFNDALNVLFNDEAISNTATELIEYRDGATKYMKELMSPPSKYKEAFQAVKDCYDTFITLTGLALAPTGSFSSYSDDFNKADQTFYNQYNALKLYVDMQ